MKAMLLRGPNMPFEPVQLPDPTPGPGEAVARVITCGSGLTIQHVKAGRRKTNFPRVLGHEITAEIVAVGAGVSHLRVGDGVTAYYYLNCGHCRHCLANLEPLCTADGGNVGIECDGGYRFDTGPSLVTMPEVFDELFANVGLDFRRDVKLVPLHPYCRYFFPDGAEFHTCDSIADMT